MRHISDGLTHDDMSLFTVKHPEIKNLMGHDARLKYIVVMMVAVQIVSAYLMRDASWLSILMVGYLWGGVINHRYITLTISP